MANKDAVKRYQEKMDQIIIRPTKEIGQTIKREAQKHNQSTQKFIIESVLMRIEREQNPDKTE